MCIGKTLFAKKYVPDNMFQAISRLFYVVIIGTYENNQTANVIFPLSFFSSGSIVFTKFVSAVRQQLRVILLRET